MGKRAVLPVEAYGIRLRLLTETDLPMTLDWRNQHHIRRWFVHSEVITPDQHFAWYQRYSLRDDDFVFIIEETGALWKPVGQASLYNIDWPGSNGEYGRLLIGERGATGKGLAEKSTNLLVDRVAFEAFGLERVVLELFADNERAIAVYRACGFQDVPGEHPMKRMVKYRRWAMGQSR